jgi:hypothetical protein
MYDKYFQANPIRIGARIPKHKGILLTGSVASGNPGVTMTFVNGSGNTFNTALTLTNSTTTIVPMQVYAIPSALPTGITAFYVN